MKLIRVIMFALCFKLCLLRSYTHTQTHKHTHKLTYTYIHTNTRIWNLKTKFRWNMQFFFSIIKSVNGSIFSLTSTGHGFFHTLRWRKRTTTNYRWQTLILESTNLENNTDTNKFVVSAIALKLVSFSFALTM